MSRGRLITLEGLDGAGKTTLGTALAADLERRGIAVRLLREPGGVELSERIRALVQQPGMTVGARAEALLYAAARAQLIDQEVAPLLSRGTWVVLDRFVDSSLAYQGAGRGLGIEPVRELNRFTTAGLEPDRTLLLTLDPALGRARQGARGAADRMERASDDFFAAVAEAYEELAASEPERVRRLDATAAPEEVLSAALAAIADLLEAP